MNYKSIILVFACGLMMVFAFFLSSVSADIFSFNSGGDNQLIINPDLFIENFFFAFNRLPVVANVILSSISGNNYTTDNLTVSFTGYDLDGDYITNITDWRLNGTSITLLNMPFDKKFIVNTSNAVRDYSTYQNNGTLGGGNISRMPTWNATGKIGGAYTFDGSNDKINFSTITLGNSNWTVSAWVLTTSGGSVLSNDNGGPVTNDLGVSLNKIYYNNYNGSWQPHYGNTTINDNVWHFLTWVNFNNQTMVMYVDGNVDSSNFNSYTTNGGPVNSIGRNWGATYRGSIDEVKIYNRVLSLEQIRLIYNSESAGYNMKNLSYTETRKGEIWQVAVTPNDYQSDGLTVLSNNLTIQNIPPTNPSNVSLRSLNLRNESDVDLNCSAYISDIDDTSLTAYINWTKNGVYQFTNTYSGKTNNTVFSGLLGNGNTTLGDNWSCSVRTYDGTSYSSWVRSNNLTIIDITNPNITIISPLSNSIYNYTSLNVTFNISINENENISRCFYSLEGAPNVTMTEINDSYFWYAPALGPGSQTVEFYCNDTSGNWGYNSTRFEILNEAAIAIDLSPELLTTVKWNIVSLPANDLDALGNNATGMTMYWINVSVTSTTVDLYVKADGALFNEGGDSLGLGNETFNYTKNVANVSGVNVSTSVMSTNYTLIGNNLVNGDTVYMKFFLDAPLSQAAGTYLNNLEFKAVRDGQLP